MECFRLGNISIIIWIIYVMDGTKYVILYNVCYDNNINIYDSIFVIVIL